MLEPLSRDELAPSEQEKMEAAFKIVPEYADALGLSIKMIHLKEQSSHNALEASITNILQRILKLTSGEG